MPDTGFPWLSNLSVRNAQPEQSLCELPVGVHWSFAVAQGPQESSEGQGSLTVLTLHASEGNTDYPVYSGF